MATVTDLPDRINRTLIPVTVALAAGIGISHYQQAPPSALSVGLVLLTGCTAWAYVAGRGRLAQALLLPFFCLTGILLGTVALAPPAATNHIANLMADGQQELVVEGTLAKAPEIMGDRTRLLMRVSSAQNQKKQFLTEGLVQLTVNGPLRHALLPGDRFLARAPIGPLRPVRVPGAPDYRAFLNQQGIRASGWLASPLQIMPLQEQQPAPTAVRLRTLPERLRTKANAFLARSVPEPFVPLYQALLTGTRSNVPPPVLEQFKASGAMHLLAISGMHLGLVTVLFTGLFTWLLSRSTKALLWLPVRKTALLLALLPLLGYAAITGLQPPAMRALIMTLAFMAAVLLDRQWCSLNTLAMAALVILLIGPASLFSVSFQLSFSATAALLLTLNSGLIPLLAREHQPFLLPRLRAWLVMSLLLSLVATLATAPLSLLYFNRLSLLSPITTLLTAPLLCFWTIPLGLIGLAVSSFAPALAGHLLNLGSLGISAAHAVISQAATLPGASWHLPTPTVFEAVAGLAALFCLLAWPVKPSARKVVIALVCLAAISATVRHLMRITSTASRITYLDVGQGNATVLELPGGYTVLLDGGGPTATERFDVGEKLIAPFLWHRGIRRLDAVVISHPHADHWNGLPFLIEHFRPATLWVNGIENDDSGYRALLARATALGIPIRIPQPGEILAHNGTANLRNLAAFHLTAPHDPSRTGGPMPSPNNQSLVLQLRHGEDACLFPGDLDAAHEERLIDHGTNLASTVLLAPHHGSKYSGSPALLTAVRPATIVVSAGGGAKSRFPDQEKVRTWHENGIPVLVTGTVGSIEARLGDGAARVRPFSR